MCKNCTWFPCAREECDISCGHCEYFTTTVQDMINEIDKESVENGNT